MQASSIARPAPAFEPLRSLALAAGCATVFALVVWGLSAVPGARVYRLLLEQVVAARVAAYVAVILVLSRFLPRVAARTWRAMGIAKPGFRVVLGGIVAGAVLIGIGVANAFALRLLFPSEVHSTGFSAELLENAHAALVVPTYGFLVVLVAPVAEELIFRAFLLNAVAQRTSKPIAIVVTALLFAIVHFNIGEAVPLVVAGAAYGWLYVRTESLAAPICAHVCYNAFTFAALLFLHD